MSHYDYVFFLFSYISSDFCFLFVYDVYLLSELYLLSLKSYLCFIKKKQNPTSRFLTSAPFKQRK